MATGKDAEGLLEVAVVDGTGGNPQVLTNTAPNRAQRLQAASGSSWGVGPREISGSGRRPKRPNRPDKDWSDKGGAVN